jgi:cold shock CspA family protein
LLDLGRVIADCTTLPWWQFSYFFPCAATTAFLQNRNRAMDRYGTVTCTAPDRGFGFITEDQTNYSIFFHAKDLKVGNVQNYGRISLDQVLPVGTAVVFTVEQTDKGVRAYEVRPR